MSRDQVPGHVLRGHSLGLQFLAEPGTLGTVCEATTYGRKPRWRTRHSDITISQHEPDGCAHREPDDGLLRGEQGRVEQLHDEHVADAGSGLAKERLHDRVDVRHRRVVHDERPRPAGADSDPAVELPAADEDPEHSRGRRRADCRAAQGGHAQCTSQL
jgi:hypothetical protein